MPPITAQQVDMLQSMLQDPTLRATLAQQTTLDGLLDGLCQAACERGVPVTRTDMLEALISDVVESPPHMVADAALADVHGGVFASSGGRFAQMINNVRDSTSGHINGLKSINDPR